MQTIDLRTHLQKHISRKSNRIDRLFGRSAEESVLINSYYASLTLNHDSPANLVLIRGGPGLGKTKLAETLSVYAIEDDGFFIRGKFDQASYRGAASLPYSGINNALSEYCSFLKKREGDRDKVVKALKKEFQKNEVSVLCEAIQSLREILDDDREEVSSHHSEFADDPTSTNNRFHILSYLVKKFIRVITSMGDPIVFLLDDMQVKLTSFSCDLTVICAGTLNVMLCLCKIVVRCILYRSCQNIGMRC